MRYMAAYLLATLGGNSSPSAKDIKKILSSVAIDADQERLDKVISELGGKNVDDLINAGLSKLCSVPSGGAVAAAPASAPAAGGAAAPDELQQIIIDAANEARKPILGPFYPSFNLHTILKKDLPRFVPENAHHLASGRLHVALTRLSDGKTILVSDFNSKEEVIQALICSCFVPFYCGLVPPTFRGVRYIDGGLSNFQPLYYLQSIITVSPFTGEIDICPRDCPVSHLCLHIFNTSFQLSVQNLCRVSYALFPPPSFVLNDFYYQGYKDAILYLIRNGKHQQYLGDQKNLNVVLKNKDIKLRQHETVLVK